MADGLKLSAAERMVLTACRVRMREIAGRKAPPKGDRWAAADLDELREYGPRYLPASWFGDGEPLPERVRVRFLRALRGLEARDLVETTAGEGGRLTWVKLSAEGERVAASPHTGAE